MASPTSDAAIKLEIAKLTGAINRRRSGDPPQVRPAQLVQQPQRPVHRPFPNTYVNPHYKPASKSYVRPGYPSTVSKPLPAPAVRPPLSAPRDVTIDGVAFETSRRSLVRKDIAVSKPPLVAKPRSQAEFTRTKAGHLLKSTRTYKPKPSRHGNMTLANNRRPYQSRRVSKKSIDKPCPRFTTTGACTRGLTCPYKHDSSKIAICWPFLQGTCPHSTDTCALSHDPTPERTPLCVHFANNGRCTRVGCPFPHVHVGARSGVCRDFAVLGFCEKGLDCERQHVRECPDFAELGECPNKRCKLPHVIRANRHRVTAPTAITSTSTLTGTPLDAPASGSVTQTDSSQPAASSVSAIDAHLGDEYISLTFVESESEEDEEEEEEQESDESDEEEGKDPNDNSDDSVDIVQ